MNSSIDYDQIREMTRGFLAKGVSAVETNAIFRGKFGAENSPTLCTIYKWRREFRGGMGERKANERNLAEREKAPEGEKQPRGAKKKQSDKHCTTCDRELSSRHYYELHMLKIHNVFVGDSRALYELLESFGPQNRIIYRCDECFGGELDYELFEDLRQHNLLEHGRKMRGETAAKMNDFEQPSLPNDDHCSPPSAFLPFSPRRSTPRIRRCRSTVPFAFSPYDRKDDDRSTDESSKTLRRSARVPKPSSALLQSLMDAKAMAKEFANFEGNGGQEEENDDNEAEPIVTIMRDGRIEVEERVSANGHSKTNVTSPAQNESKMEKIEVTHDWSGQQWDWPLQHNDGVVKVHNTPDKWEVGLDVAFFTPNEIEVKVVADHLNILCKHEARSDVHGSVSREIFRAYRLPDDVNTSSIKSHLTQNGVLRVSGQKK